MVKTGQNLHCKHQQRHKNNTVMSADKIFIQTNATTCTCELETEKYDSWHSKNGGLLP